MLSTSVLGQGTEHQGPEGRDSRGKPTMGIPWPRWAAAGLRYRHRKRLPLRSARRFNGLSPTSPGRVTSLQTGKADLALANFTETPTRALSVTFSIPYVTVKGHNMGLAASHLNTIADMNNAHAKVANVRGGTPSRRRQQSVQTVRYLTSRMLPTLSRLSMRDKRMSLRTTPCSTAVRWRITRQIQTDTRLSVSRARVHRFTVRRF